MFGRDVWKLFVGGVMFVLVACTGPAAETQPVATEVPGVPTPEGRAIVFGDISDDPGEVIEGTQPLADYVAAQLGDFGITEGQVRVVATAEEMARLLESGEVDLYFDSVYPATLVSDASGAQPFLRRWRYGVEEYNTIIFASAESGITSVDDLPGHLIALDNPFSTSGYLLPAVSLTEHGLKLVGKQSYDDPVAGDEVGFVFSYDDENTLQWILSGLVAAGATDDYNYNVAFPPEAREKLVLLAETESVPRQVVVARPGMDPGLLETVKQILVTAHESEAGAAALEPFQTSRFDEFPEGIEAAQERMREMMEIVQNIPMP
jgi:phosphonate transport system substrate-binding protein